MLLEQRAENCGVHDARFIWVMTRGDNVTELNKGRKAKLRTGTGRLTRYLSSEDGEVESVSRYKRVLLT
jgi:hypothetical protein